MNYYKITNRNILSAAAAFLACTLFLTSCGNKENKTADQDNSADTAVSETDVSAQEPESSSEEAVTEASYDLSSGEYSFNEENQIEKQVIWETGDGIRVTAVKLSHDVNFDAHANLEVETSNDSGKDIILSLANNTISVNGFNLTSLMYSSVKTGETSTATIGLDISELEKSGINNISEIKFALQIMDPDQEYDVSAESEPITVKTTNTASDEEYVADGEEIYSSDGITVTELGLTENDNGSPEFRFLVENQSEKMIRIKAENFCVNGTSVPSSLYPGEVSAGNKSVMHITLTSDDRQTYGIDELTDASVTFGIYDYDDYTLLGTSEEINLKTE